MSPYIEIQCSTIDTFLLGSDVYFPFSEFAGIRNTWKTLGLGDNLRVELIDYKAINLLSCVTLDVENCHSTVHIKQANLSMLEYRRSFGLTMKESIKENN